MISSPCACTESMVFTCNPHFHSPCILSTLWFTTAFACINSMPIIFVPTKCSHTLQPLSVVTWRSRHVCAARLISKHTHRFDLQLLEGVGYAYGSHCHDTHCGHCKRACHCNVKQHWPGRQAGKQAGRQAGRRAGRQAGRQTCRRADTSAGGHAENNTSQLPVVQVIQHTVVACITYASTMTTSAWWQARWRARDITCTTCFIG